MAIYNDFRIRHECQSNADLKYQYAVAFVAR